MGTGFCHFSLFPPLGRGGSGRLLVTGKAEVELGSGHNLLGGPLTSNTPMPVSYPQAPVPSPAAMLPAKSEFPLPGY